jgi:HD-like signal output (HDOD) protein
MSQVTLPETVKNLLTSQPIELPIFHPVALKLQRMLLDYDFSVDEVSQVANEDQALASQMLRMANSPLYMGRTKVATIKEATTRLGAQQVINIAIAASQASIHASENPFFDSYLDELWMHSHGSAFGARWLAHNCGLRGIADEIYLAALLHDVGKLYLIKSIEQLSTSDAISVLFDNDQIMEIFDSMHVEQGYRLMQHWNFPAMYCDVTRFHHLQDLDPVNKMLVIVRFVNQVCHKVGLGLKKEPDIDLKATIEAELLDIDEQQISELESLLLESSLWSRGIA